MAGFPIWTFCAVASISLQTNYWCVTEGFQPGTGVSQRALIFLYVAHTISTAFYSEATCVAPVYKDHLCTRTTCVQGTPVYKGHLYTRATCVQGPPVHKDHLCTRTTCVQGPPVHKDHLCTRATCVQGPPVHKGHLYTRATCVGPPVYKGHLEPSYQCLLFCVIVFSRTGGGPDIS